jgi:hypothetical protein
MYYFDKTTGWAIFWAIISRTRLVTLIESHSRKEEKKVCIGRTSVPT